MDKKLPEPNVLETAHSSCSEFVKKDVFEDRKQVSVEEVVTLIAALTDISVSLLSRFLKDQVDLAKATGVGRDVFKYILGRVGVRKCSNDC